MDSSFYLKATAIWKQISNGKVKLMNPAKLEHRYINSIFHVGDYYYYILDLAQGVFLYVSPEIEAILGYPSEIPVNDFLSKIHPDDKRYFLSFEHTAKEFFKALDISRIRDYKISYDFRMKKANGHYIRLLHQVVCLNHCDRGYPLHALGVHTDITHIKGEGVPKLSFIGLNGAPSYYDYGSFDRNGFPEEASFTKREIEIIRYIAQGLKSAEIAHHLHISEHTVNNHRKNIIKKSKLSISQLVFKAIREGWI